MKQQTSKFRREFLIVVILCCLGAYATAKFALHQAVPLSFWIMTAFISIATFFIFKILMDANVNKRPPVFVNYFLAALTGKLMLSAILLLVVGLADRSNLKFSAIGFFIVYTLLTVVELKNLLPLIRNSDR
ncbi:hypothetical protein G3O08_13610 [Cryomorpha ignava]|uniref:Uncharacterized protein n=1 Tax=Cryomorpha ignava TaxID=101383 RepID=A0A7K3WS82_9FLAO|nr:hypothetical protein [Cryomorpha ignava]NEN24539.1 hypothetical protein [Cryomorpha ignava]